MSLRGCSPRSSSLAITPRWNVTAAPCSASRRSRARREDLNQANKLSRTYTTLLESLNRHRGKGQQKVTVEHVHVHEGGQAIVGNVEAGGWVRIEIKGTTPCKANYPCTRRHDAERGRDAGAECQSPAMKNGRCRMHGGTSPGAPKGNKNALKHGRYTAEAIARRREIAELIRTARKFA